MVNEHAQAMGKLSWEKKTKEQKEAVILRIKHMKKKIKKLKK